MSLEKPTNIWDFCCDHPIATFFIILVLITGLNGIVSSFTRHVEPADTCGDQVTGSILR